MQIFFDLRAAMQPGGKRPYRGFEQITEHQITDRQKRRGRRRRGQSESAGQTTKTQTRLSRDSHTNNHRATAKAAYPLKILKRYKWQPLSKKQITSSHL